MPVKIMDLQIVVFTACLVHIVKITSPQIKILYLNNSMSKEAGTGTLHLVFTSNMTLLKKGMWFLDHFLIKVQCGLVTVDIIRY